MLGASRISGFFRTTDSKRARNFYEGVLGLECLSENEYVLVFRSHHSTVIGQKLEEFSPLPSTVLGWEVADLEKAAMGLAQHGVVFERYPWMEQDKLGIWTSPDGHKMAWFKDPDGNVLSLGETS